MNRITKVSDNITLIERADGFHSQIVIPMYAPFNDYLFTRDITEAKGKALELYKEYRG